MATTDMVAFDCQNWVNVYQSLVNKFIHFQKLIRQIITGKNIRAVYTS